MNRMLLGGILIVVAVLVAVIFLVGWFASERIIHPAQDPSPYCAQGNPSPSCQVTYSLPTQEVHFQSRDGLQLAAWFIPGTSGACVLLAHGRGGYKDWMLPHALYLHKAGFSTLLLDFRYRGESQGKAQTLGARESWDIQSAVDYLRKRPEVDPMRIGVQGNSMGAVAAILAAAERPDIRGVVADIPFTSVNHMLGHAFKQEFRLPSFPFAYFTKWITELRLGDDLDRVAPIEAVGRLGGRPIFFIDNAEDELFPRNSVELLYETAQEPKLYWEVVGAAHGQGWETAPDEFERRVLAFWRDTFGIIEGK